MSDQGGWSDDWQYRFPNWFVINSFSLYDAILNMRSFHDLHCLPISWVHIYIVGYRAHARACIPRCLDDWVDDGIWDCTCWSWCISQNKCFINKRVEGDYSVIAVWVPL